jgi:predicted nucleic acid-binding protein
VIPDARTPLEAIELLRRIVALPDHAFWMDDLSIAASEHIAAERIHGHRQVTDAHLLALALRHGGRLATFDRGIAELMPSGPGRDRVLLVL